MAASSGVNPPNIVLLMTDQQRADSLGCYGGPSGGAVATPHLDRLAAEGVTFDRACCTNPICTPSRASLMTGHHLPRHGVTAIDSPLADRHVMFPQRLRERGYCAGLVGKLHAQAGGIEAQRRHPHDGFDVYEQYYGGGAMMDSPLNAYAPWCKERRPDVYERLVEFEKHAGPIPREVHMNTWAAERAAAFLDGAADAQNGDGPLFLMVSVFDPHNPYDDHPPEAERRVDAGRLPPLIPPPEDRSAWPEAVERHAADNYFADFRNLSEEEVQRMRVGYHAEVALIDDLVGEVLAMLDERGLADDTLVLFCSDHGDLLGDHGLMVKGGVPYEANIRVPVIARWPGRLADGGRYARPIQLNDLSAMILAAAGVEPDELVEVMPDAVDPTPGLRAGTARLAGDVPRREIAVNAYRNSGFARGHVPFDPPIHLTVATDGRFKLALYHNPPAPGEAPAVTAGQFFDLDEDPTEQRDLFDTPRHPEARGRLWEAVEQFLRDEAATTDCAVSKVIPTPREE